LEKVDARDIARAVETAGFDSLWVTDHILMPAVVESKYPFSPDGKFFLPEDGLWFEAITTLSYAAAVTERLRLGIGVCVVALRDPRLLSQQLATLDHLTGGRVSLGVGAGWMLEEFDVMEVPTAARGERLDAAIDLLRACWTGEPPGGRYGPFSIPDGVKARPAPRQSRIPLLFAGEGPRALDRMVRRGDGWYGASGIGQMLPMETVRSVRDGLAERCDKFGRSMEEMTLALRLAIPRSKLGSQEVHDALQEYAQAGITDLTIDFSFRSLESAREGLASLAETVRDLRGDEGHDRSAREVVGLA
jgi:probable F420-dependent oxidoreductase